MKRTLHTLRYLKPQQWLYLLKHRLLPRRLAFKPAMPPDAAIYHAKTLALPETVCATFPAPPPLDWHLVQAFTSGAIQPSRLPLLEQFHLHYFHYLFHPQFSEEQTGTILNRWLTRHPPGDYPAWHPYPLSLRLGNWLLYYLSHKLLFQHYHQLEHQFLRSAHQQAQVLYQNFEFHLMGNHLLENARALVMAGVVFNESRWMEYGSKILCQQLQEQFSVDGCHFENSLLYQNILVKHLLDTLLILSHCTAKVTHPIIPTLKTELETVTRRAVTFLVQMGGDLPEPPLWGDTALDMMYAFKELYRYAQTVLNTPIEQPATGFYLSPAGYGIYRNPVELLIVDGAPLGPYYQPGHAHCDLLSFTYHFHQLPIFVDSGLGNYRETPLRDYARSMAAHNTVTVHAQPQAECWKIFRMGRRVSPGGLTQPSPNAFEGWYQHQWAPQNKRYTHVRSFRHLKKGSWIIEDVITGGEGPVEVRFHLHPRVLVKQPEAERSILKLQHEAAVLYFCWKPSILRFQLVENWYIPHYDAPQQNQTIVLQTTFSQKINLKYGIFLNLEDARHFLGLPHASVE